MAAASDQTKKLIRNSAHNQSLSALKLPELEMQAAEFRGTHGDPFKRRSTFHDMKSAMAQESRSNGYKVYAANPESGDEEESTATKMEKMRQMRRSWGDSLASFGRNFPSLFGSGGSSGGGGSNNSTPRRPSRASLRLEHELLGYKNRGSLPAKIQKLAPATKSDYSLWIALVDLGDGGDPSLTLNVPDQYPFSGPQVMFRGHTIHFVMGQPQFSEHEISENELKRIHHVSWTPAQNLLDAAVASMNLFESQPKSKPPEAAFPEAANASAAEEEVPTTTATPVTPVTKADLEHTSLPLLGDPKAPLETILSRDASDYGGSPA